MEEVRTKRCTKCGEVKPFSEFHNDKSFKDGKTYACKECRNKFGKIYRLSHSEERAEYDKQYLLDHREYLLLYKRNYNLINRDVLVEQGKQNRRLNPISYLFKGAKHRAKTKGVSFSINKADVIIPDICPIFDIPLAVGEGTTHDGSPTLDRVTPDFGYIPGNIVVISHKANTIKSNGTAEEHRRIADWMEGKILPNPEPQNFGFKATRQLLYSAKDRAKDKNLAFDLKIEDIGIPKFCPILGVPLEKGTRQFHNNSPTLDRRYPEKGYTRDNVGVISFRANTIKNFGTADEHRKIADWMDSFLQKKAA